MTVDSHDAVITAIKNEIGLGVVASHLVHNELGDGSIIHIKVSETEIMNAISLVQLQEKIPTYTEKFFMNYLLDTINKVLSKKHTGLKLL